MFGISIFSFLFQVRHCWYECAFWRNCCQSLPSPLNQKLYEVDAIWPHCVLKCMSSSSRPPEGLYQIFISEFFEIEIPFHSKNLLLKISILEYWRTLFESEICEMLQFMHVKILFLKFSLCQGTLRDGRRGTRGARQAGLAGRPTGCFISICNEGRTLCGLWKIDRSS